MEVPLTNIEANPSKLKVAISPRLIAAVAYLLPSIGGVLSSLYLMNVLRAMGENIGAGIDTILVALAESIVPALVSLYLAAFGGFIVIIVLISRMLMQTKTASPPVWFFVLCGLFFLIPAGSFFEAESLIIEILIAPSASTGIAEVASNISLFLILSIGSAVVVFLILLVISVVPFSVRSKPKWSSLIAAIFIEFLIIAVVVAFQLRFLWLYKAGV